MLNLLERAHRYKKRQDDYTKATRLILEKNLSEEELTQFVNIYDDWSSLSEGCYIAELTYLQFEGQLYQCMKGMGHNKENSLTPNITLDRFKKVTTVDGKEEI